MANRAVPARIRFDMVGGLAVMIAKHLKRSKKVKQGIKAARFR